MDKWLGESKSSSKKTEKEEKEYSKEEIEAAKLKKLKNLMGKKQEKKKPNKPIETEHNDFLSSLNEFKEWLNKRNYLKGDLDKVEVWIKILHRKIYNESNELSAESKDHLERLKKRFKKIPPTLLEEKMRIAINKKLQGTKRTSSDTYYLRKLKGIVQEKLVEANYYQILKEILDL